MPLPGNIPILHLQSRSLFQLLPHTVNSLLTSTTWCLADTSNSTCQTEIIDFSPVLFLHCSLFWRHNYNVHSCISQNLYSYFLQLFSSLSMSKYNQVLLILSAKCLKHFHFPPYHWLYASLGHHHLSLKSCIYLLPGLHWLILGPLSFLTHQIKWSFSSKIPNKLFFCENFLVISQKS